MRNLPNDPPETIPQSPTVTAPFTQGGLRTAVLLWSDFSEHIDIISPYRTILKNAPGQKPPLCKGRWHGVSRAGGIVRLTPRYILLATPPGSLRWVAFSAMRKPPKNRQRRGLPPPCGIHPAGTRLLLRQGDVRPLARWGHIDGMVIRLGAPAPLLAYASTPRALPW